MKRLQIRGLRFELRDAETGARKEYVRKKSEGGVPLCLLCGKPIPLAPDFLGGEGPRERRSCAFDTAACAATWAEAVARQVVHPDPELDVPDPAGGDPLNGPIVTEAARREAESRRILRGARRAVNPETDDPPPGIKRAETPELVCRRIARWTGRREWHQVLDAVDDLAPRGLLHPALVLVSATEWSAAAKVVAAERDEKRRAAKAKKKIANLAKMV